MPTIVPKNAEHMQQLLVALIAAAGSQQDRVRTLSSGPLTCFEVDDELAAVVGFPVTAVSSAPPVIQEETASEPPTESEAVPAAPKKSTRKS